MYHTHNTSLKNMGYTVFGGDPIGVSYFKKCIKWYLFISNAYHIFSSSDFKSHKMSFSPVNPGVTHSVTLYSS